MKIHAQARLQEVLEMSDADKGMYQITIEPDDFETVKIGKVYKFNGRKARVLKKNPPSRNNKTGGKPTVTVDWIR